MLLRKASFLLKAFALLAICGEKVLVLGTGQNNSGKLINSGDVHVKNHSY